MSRAQSVRDQLEDAINKAHDDINTYQKELEMKLKSISKKGLEQVDQAIQYIKSQEFASTLLENIEERVEPIRTDLKSKEQIIRNLVDTILNRAKEVRENLLADPVGQVQALRNRVLRTAKKTVKKTKKTAATKTKKPTKKAK